MEQPTPVNHEYLYPDLLAVREYVEHLVSFCDQTYRKFTKLTEDDAAKNEPLKYEFREYNYKKSWPFEFRVHFWTNSMVSVDFDNESAFRAAVNNGQLNDISKLIIDLGLSFGRGKEGSVTEHKNEIKIEFAPNNTKYTRVSSFADPEIDEIEKQIISALEDFPSTKTIFTPEQKFNV